MAIDLTKFKSILKQFPTGELKSILGENLSDMLLEWSQGNGALFTKSMLADMIATVHGLGVLKDKKIRADFLARVHDSEILSLRDCLSNRHLREKGTVAEIRERIATMSWSDKPEMRGFLSLISIDEDIFATKINEEAEETIDASTRFYELLDYQFVIKQRLLTELNNSEIELNKMLVQMPTGTGKTKTAMHTLIHHFCFDLKKKGLIIWMAHTTELLQQAYDTFTAAWKHIGNGEVKAYKLWGSYNTAITNDSLNGVMFCGFQKLMSIAKSNVVLFELLAQNCRLVVVDEAHKAAASETKKVVSQLMTKKSTMCNRSLIGLTATPGRNVSNEADIERLVSMFDSKIIGISPTLLNQINLSAQRAQNIKDNDDIVLYFQKRHILAKLKRKPLTYAEKLSDGELKLLKIKAMENGYDDYTDEFLKVIGRNKSRNIAILNEIIRLNSENMPTIVFACSVEQGALLSTALTLKGVNNACVFGNMATSERALAIKRFKDREDDMNVLINYEVLTTGFDATNIRCVFITRPTKSVVLYSQMIGRGLRGPLMGGNEECILIDIEDNLDNYPNEAFAFKYFGNYWSNN
jgi:superfamily II DNA or RNA helicase